MPENQNDWPDPDPNPIPIPVPVPVPGDPQAGPAPRRARAATAAERATMGPRAPGFCESLLSGIGRAIDEDPEGAVCAVSLLGALFSPRRRDACLRVAEASARARRARSGKP